MDINSARPASKVATVLRVTGGNFLEMFDFFLFGFYASNIAHAFFPSQDQAQVSSWEAYRSTSPKWRRLGTKGFMLPGNRAVSRWRSWRRRCLATC